MIFNGIQKDYLKVSKDFTIPTISKIEYSAQESRNGVRIKRQRIPELTLEVPIIIRDNGIGLDFIKRDLTQWLYNDGDKKLYFSHFPNYYYLARLLDIDLIDHPNAMLGTISFFCQTPFKHGKAHNLALTPTNKTFTITGQTETPWTVEVTFTANTNRFELWAGYIYLQLNFAFVAGDKLTIEYAGRKVFLNGNDLRKAVSMSSNFAELKPGTVSMRANHASVLKYDERYY